jgi:hypothetical protein
MIDLAGVRSLLDLLRMYAPYYLQIAKISEEYTSSFKVAAANPRAMPTEEQFNRVMENLKMALDICNRMHLQVSARSLERTIAEFTQNRPNMGLTKQRYLEWYSCFQSEVAGQIYLLVLPHRVGYWTSEADGLLGTTINRILPAIESFPDAAYDLKEAGNCFAFERFTACVYHLMRVAEFGLVSVAQSIGVDEEKINKGWGRVYPGDRVCH